MIYKAAPAWTFKGKTKTPILESSPSPGSYEPQTKATLTKAPSWKMGKELRSKQNLEKSPSPTTYEPPSSQKSHKMGIIGHEVRGKQNHQTSPGPSSYIISRPKDTTSISFAAKYEFINKTAHYPGPGQYQLPDKKEKRGIVVGRQNRFTTDHPDQVKNPGPGTYEWKRPSSANVSFTTAPRMSHQSSKDLVGPGQYDIKSEFQKSTKGFTLSSKYKKAEPDTTPGPSNYSPTHCDLTSSPKISFSKKYKERAPDRSPSPNQYDPEYNKLVCKTESYSVGKAQRLPLYGDNNIPGPGAYLSTQYNNTGVELSLGKSRKIEEKEDFPGPGAYNPDKSVVQKRPSTAKIGRSKRFYKLNTEATTPSPSLYNSNSTSQIRTPKYSFSRKKKLEDKYENVPGPGAYTLGSSLCNLSAYALRK